MSQKVIREITGIKTIEELIKHLDKVKHLFENELIEITMEIEPENKDKVVIYLKRIRNNE